MKPINFQTKDYFLQIWNEMGIDVNAEVEFTFSIDKKDYIVWEDPLKQGKEISANDAKFKIEENSSFSYNGQKVIIYINNQLIQYKDKGYKFHLAWCRTLDSMKQRGVFNKYVVSTNTDGFFRIKYISNNEVVEEKIEKLNVCKNCLATLNWKKYNESSYKEKMNIYENFSLNEFFDTFSNDNKSNFAYLPKETDVTAPPNLYPAEWRELSNLYREQHHWTCAKCGARILMSDRKKLHVHHRDGVKSNCKASNLIVLCANCHQREHKDHKILNSDL